MTYRCFSCKFETKNQSNEWNKKPAKQMMIWWLCEWMVMMMMMMKIWILGYLDMWVDVLKHIFWVPSGCYESIIWKGKRISFHIYIRITYIYNYNYIYYRFCLKKTEKNKHQQLMISNHKWQIIKQKACWNGGNSTQ